VSQSRKGVFPALCFSAFQQPRVYHPARTMASSWNRKYDEAQMQKGDAMIIGVLNHQMSRRKLFLKDFAELLYPVICLAVFAGELEPRFSKAHIARAVSKLTFYSEQKRCSGGPMRAFEPLARRDARNGRFSLRPRSYRLVPG
jgi:hypothetical protein